MHLIKIRVLGRFSANFYFNCEHFLFVSLYCKTKTKKFADFIKKTADFILKNSGFYREIRGVSKFNDN